jgi:beta-glucosidase
MFVRATWCPISPFEKRLRKFDKVFLKKGDKKTVEFTLTDEDFSYVDEDYKTVKHNGEHKLLVEGLECIVNFE